MTRAILLLALAFASLPAVATDVYHEESGNAVNTCTPALTYYDRGLRRRPRAIVNEGAIPAFVNCAFRAPTNSYGQESFGVVVVNAGPSAVSVTCTGISGVESTISDFKPKTISVPAGGERLFKWTYQADHGGTRWNDHRDDQNTGLQCLLPTDVGMSELPQAYRQK